MEPRSRDSLWNRVQIFRVGLLSVFFLFFSSLYLSLSVSLSLSPFLTKHWFSSLLNVVFIASTVIWYYCLKVLYTNHCFFSVNDYWTLRMLCTSVRFVLLRFVQKKKKKILKICCWYKKKGKKRIFYIYNIFFESFCPSCWISMNWKEKKKKKNNRLYVRISNIEILFEFFLRWM